MDESKSRIIHEYDPLKRREYYLKNRQLKGHTPRAITTAAKPRHKAAVKPGLDRQQRQAQRRRELQAQVDALKARLKKLREALAELVKAAKARSGVKTPDKKDPGKPGTKKPAPKLTPGQKAEAAERAKESYEKNKDKILADEVKSLTAKIKAIQERIAKMQKASSAGANKTQNKK